MGETFTNFGQAVQLQPAVMEASANNSGYTYYKTESGVTLAVTNRVLVKTLNPDSQNSLYILENVARGEVLASFPEFTLILLHLRQNNALSYSRELLKHKEVLYAQPDFLQVSRSRFGFLGKRESQPVWPHWKQSIELENIKIKGEGIRVAVIDDAFDMNHPALRHAHLQFSIDTGTRLEDVAPQEAHEKHGTMVAGLLLAQWQEKELSGLVPGADFIAVRNLYNWTSNIVLAMYLSYLAKADVINCSWGMPMLLQPIAETVQAISRLGRAGKGTAIVFAAGNSQEQVDHPMTLQSMDEVISVAGVDSDYRVITNFGRTVDIAAPSLLPTIDPRNYDKVSYIGGSSSAAPVVTAVIAMMYAVAPQLTVEQLRSLLRESSQELPAFSGRMHEFGVVNAGRAVSLAESWNRQKHK
ncbi:S8 family peptidase [Hahella ganghwensis]|uniref:S8 family peptidase n=1 Tax=Hahella ganghwensis TaxID=286420 RepID=UPI00039BB96E|nr:S8/S53 family peptidase [Hahella ganghwensis]